MYTDSFILQITKNENIYVDFAQFVEIRFYSSNSKLQMPLPRGKNEKLIGLMKHKFRSKINKYE